MFKFKEGYTVPRSQEIHEAYAIEEDGLYGNISAERMVKLAWHFLRLQQKPVYFYLELPCTSDEEAEQNTKGSKGEHVKVYYADALDAQAAMLIIADNRKLLTRDGLVKFGFGMPEPPTELSFDKYNIFRILTGEASKYGSMLQDLGIPQEKVVLTAWDLIDEDHPGITRSVQYDGCSIYDLPEILKRWGLYLAEIRPVEDDFATADVDYGPITSKEQEEAAEKFLVAGAKEYQEKNFALALQYYKQAAEFGNVTALSNLGYCYYYGRSVPVDYKEAAKYFDKAAARGDVSAMYKLGDMVKNGQLQGTTTAYHYYVAAYTLATRDKDPETYPDACLRLASYDKEHQKFLLQEAVKYFKIRMDWGDNFTAGVLKRAEQELAKLSKDDQA